MIKDNHPNKEQVGEKRDKLNERWKKLAFELEARRAELKEAGGAVALIDGINDLEELLRQKEKLAASEDYGKDLPSVLAHQKKQEALGRDLEGIACKVDDLGRDSKKFAETNPDAHAAKVLAEKHEDLTKLLDKVKALADDRAKKLEDAHKLHKFLADANEADLLLAQKTKETEAIEKPKDVRGAEAGLKKLEKLQKAVEANDGQLQNLMREGEELEALGHPASSEIKAKREKLQADRAALGEKQKAKEEELRSVYDLEKFRENVSDANNWLSEKRREADAEDVPKDTADAQKMIKRAEELKNETENYDESLKAVRQEGEKLVSQGHPEKAAVEEMLEKLVVERKELGAAVDARKKRLEENLSLLAFDRDAQEVEDWLDEAEAVFANKELPESPEALAEMLKKHEALHADAKLEHTKVKHVDHTGTKLIGEDHHAKEHIGSRRDKVMERWNALDATLADKKKEIENAITMQLYLRDADELLAWATDKQAELAESLLHPEALSEKDRLKKQEELELELAAKKKKLEDLKKTLQGYEGREGIDTTDARKKTTEIEEILNNLSLDTGKASKQIKEAAALRQSERDFNDLDLWLREVEAALASEDLGADLAAVQALLKKHTGVESDIKVHEKPVHEAAKIAQGLIDGGHYAADNLKQRKETLEARYAAVQEKAKVRRARLEDSLKQHKYLRGLEEERKYVKYKTSLAVSTDFGKDSTSTQKMLSKHKVLAEELENHDKTTHHQLRTTGHQLIEEKAVPTEAVAAALESLAQEWEKLKGHSASREKSLVQNAEWFDFKVDLDEELSWLEQQIGLLEAAQLPGESMSSCKTMMKQNDSLMGEIKTHEGRVHTVKAAGDAAVGKGNSHERDIRDAQKDLDQKLAALQTLATSRKSALQFALQRLEFNKDASGIKTFMKVNHDTVHSTHLGDDQAATQKLLDDLKLFEAKCDAIDAQVTRLVASTASLVGASHPDTPVVEAKSAEVVKEWKDFKHKVAERKAALLGAHSGRKATDESCLAFAEKAATLNNWMDNAMEDLTDPISVNSVEEAKALEANHDKFQQSAKSTTGEMDGLVSHGKEIKGLGVESNPYTPFTGDSLAEKWAQSNAAASDRTGHIAEEIKHQEDNDRLRREYANVANEFAAWLETTKATLVDAGNLTLEEQLEGIKARNVEIEAHASKVDSINELSHKIEAAFILDNKYTEHSAISLSQKYEALKRLGTVVQFNTEQKIAAKNNSGITEEEKKDWEETFEFFDKTKKGTLDHLEFKSALRGLGFNLPVVVEGQKDEEFEQILAFVDSNNNGQISKQEFIDFMTSQKTTKVSSAQEVIASFMMISHDKDIVTEEDMRAALPPNQAEYCLRHMKQVEGGYDFKSFVNDFFSQEETESFASKSTPSSTPSVESWGTHRAEKTANFQQTRQARKEKGEIAMKEQQQALHDQKKKREAAKQQ